MFTAATGPALSQTARIAHFSHSSRLETLAGVALDNFGTPPAAFRIDSVQVLLDTEAAEYGVRTPSHGQAEKEARNRKWTGYSAQHYVCMTKGRSPKVKIMGLMVDSVRVLSDTTIVKYARLKGCNDALSDAQF